MTSGQADAVLPRDPAVQVMVSTEVGSEGLDFQFCYHLVNYDLPWNPMVVEQRIGRIDRFGQEHDVSISTTWSSRGPSRRSPSASLRAHRDLPRKYRGP